ncbi:hypothetical protein CUR178_04517 [Leishmania enriettii]|uniref:Uncharacterized protein n=1 Tax=Leishmania enriettii TaxID=5663 RepID=A0A836GWD0_LEIEN|nr:hypothetical protein CUR178_04517 [Leishmania enriettii]
MAPKARPSPTAEGLSSSSQNATEPMLQGAYEQDESNDFQSMTNEIAAFEERLEQQRGRGDSAAARNVSGTRASGSRQRPSAPATGSAQQPHPSSRAAPSTVANAAGAPCADLHRAAYRGPSEEEQAAQTQRREDVEDVRQLEDRFGGYDDDDSDVDAAPRRNKKGL